METPPGTIRQAAAAAAAAAATRLDVNLELKQTANPAQTAVADVLERPPVIYGRAAAMTRLDDDVEQ